MLDEQLAPLGHDSVRSATREASSAGLRDVLRALRPIVGAGAIEAAGRAAPLERFVMGGDPPTVATCVPLELGVRTVTVAASTSPLTPGVDAFLDGVQRSRIVGYVHGVPMVFATVAAVVRERVDRKLATWRDPRVRHLLLTERATVGEDVWRALTESGIALVDLAEGAETSTHPLATRARALERVGAERETLERRLAAEWCEEEFRWLWIDGGISGNLAIDASSPAFGVVKSHTTLYGDAAAIRDTLALPFGARSPLFLVTHRARLGVASWYLRVHDAHDGDPLHGLVRVELSPPNALFASSDPHRASPNTDAVAMLAERANTISGWILADRAPVALPDPRWDTLSYGVYACEQFLRALIGP